MRTLRQSEKQRAGLHQVMNPARSKPRDNDIGSSRRRLIEPGHWGVSGTLWPKPFFDGCAAPIRQAPTNFEKGYNHAS